MKSSTTKSGFSLVELLVVIAIISLLASVILTSLGGARMAARDARRISDIRQIRIALELYRNAKGDYPVALPWIYSTDSSWNTLQTELAPYLPNLPKDPLNSSDQPWADGNYSYAYAYDPADSINYNYGKDKRYDLVTQLENRSNPLRCEIKQWMTVWDDTVWCGPAHRFSNYLYTGEY